MKNPMVHFEIPADNAERAIKFYKKIFDWKIEKFPMADGDYYVIRTIDVDDKMMPVQAGGINGGLVERKNPGQMFMNYIKVDDIDETLKEIENNGGEICLPKQEIGKDMGWIACFRDTEGNMMGLHELPKK